VDLTTAATLAVFLAAAGYLVACWLWPFAACLSCSGSGRHTSPGGKAWRHCRRCKGSGTRLRVGRAVWNSLHR